MLLATWFENSKTGTISAAWFQNDEREATAMGRLGRSCIPTIGPINPLASMSALVCSRHSVSLQVESGDPGIWLQG